MTEKTKGRLAYGWLWFYFFIMTAASVYIYVEALVFVKLLLSDYKVLSNALEIKKGNWIASSIQLIGGILFCWRVVKVVVLHGSPIPFWMNVGWGRQDGGIAGRLVTMVHIGDEDVYSELYTGEFWFGVIFRAHHSSDKIMRSRLEFLIAAIPWGRSFIIGEGRILFLKHDNKTRAIVYRQRADKYTKTRDRMTPDEYRKKMVGNMEIVANNLKNQNTTNRIDGLNWQVYPGGYGVITDDFGSHLTYTTRSGKYIVGLVNGVSYDGDKLESITALRRMAGETLNPNHGG